jgi:PHS family inorganic phosphate transporter-like MFS transporter
MANFFQNFGPNTTTFIIPGELFPTRYRSTAHGIAAASGKLGALISQAIFYRLKSTTRSPRFIETVYVHQPHTRYHES